MNNPRKNLKLAKIYFLKEIPAIPSLEVVISGDLSRLFAKKRDKKKNDKTKSDKRSAFLLKQNRGKMCVPSLFFSNAKKKKFKRLYKKRNDRDKPIEEIKIAKKTFAETL